MKLIERINCPECGHEIDIVIENNDILVIGGCVGCDYMPTLDEAYDGLHDEYIDAARYRGMDEMAIIGDYK